MGALGPSFPTIYSRHKQSKQCRCGFSFSPGSGLVNGKGAFLVMMMTKLAAYGVEVVVLVHMCMYA